MGSPGEGAVGVGWGRCWERVPEGGGVTMSLFQIGFFKRTRPPMEEDTQEPGQAQEMGGTQS